jgi:hypothetical protein
MTPSGYQRFMDLRRENTQDSHKSSTTREETMIPFTIGNDTAHLSPNELIKLIQEIQSSVLIEGKSVNSQNALPKNPNVI